MKYIFFGELYKDTVVEAGSYKEAYDKIVSEFYTDCVCAGCKTQTAGVEFIEISAWAEIWDEVEEEFFSYERRPMFICKESDYKKLPQSFLGLFK